MIDKYELGDIVNLDSRGFAEAEQHQSRLPTTPTLQVLAKVTGSQCTASPCMFLKREFPLGNCVNYMVYSTTLVVLHCTKIVIMFEL